MPAARKGQIMDFIEKIFGINPDGATGSLEFLLLALPAAAVAYITLQQPTPEHRSELTCSVSMRVA